MTTRYVAQLFEAAGADCVVRLDVHNLPAFQNAFRCRTVHLEARGLFAPGIRDLAGRAAGDGLLGSSAPSCCAGTRDGDGRGGPFGFMEKHRSGGVVSGSLFAGEVEGRAVFIVDDMVSTGGTMRCAAAACRERGAHAVLSLATHGLFGPGAEAMLADPAIDRILVTGSLVSAVKPRAAPRRTGSRSSPPRRSRRGDPSAARRRIGRRPARHRGLRLTGPR